MYIEFTFGPKTGTFEHLDRAAANAAIAAGFARPAVDTSRRPHVELPVGVVSGHNHDTVPPSSPTPRWFVRKTEISGKVIIFCQFMTETMRYETLDAAVAAGVPQEVVDSYNALVPADQNRREANSADREAIAKSMQAQDAAWRNGDIRRY